MKNAVLLCLLMFLLRGYLNAQDSDYPPILGKDPYMPILGKDFTGWYDYIYYSNGKGGKFTLKTYTDGDIVFKGKTYIRLQFDRFDFKTNKTQREGPEYLREDTTQRKVYALDYIHGIEFVLYDFSLKPGDVFDFGDWTGIRYLRSIDHTLTTCNSSVRIKNRVFHFTDYNDEFPITWVEGVGAITGLFWYFVEQDCPYYEELRETVICKVRDNSLDFQQEGFQGVNCPFGLIPTNQHIMQEVQFQIIPNPANSIIRISGDPVELGFADYRIFNVTGQVIKTGVLDPAPVNILDVSAFREGFYFIEIYNDSKNLLTSQKFIVMN